MPDLDQPLGEYPHLETESATQLRCGESMQHAHTTALTALREAHREAEELRRENVALRAQLDHALHQKDHWYMAAMGGKLAP